MKIAECNGTSLAFIGDAVMTLYVRMLLMEKGFRRPNDLQRHSVAWVSANAQAKFLMKLKEDAFFTEKEWSIAMRGRNSNIQSKAKNANIQTYRLSTGLEAIFGYLYITKQNERLQQLWSAIQQIGESR